MLYRLLRENVDDNTIQGLADIISKKRKKVMMRRVFDALNKLNKLSFDEEGKLDEASKKILLESVETSLFSDDVSRSIANKIFEADPTRNNKYVRWIVKNYLLEKLNYFGVQETLLKFDEDHYKLKEYLQVFDERKDTLKSLGIETDINKYSSIQDLFTNAVKKVRDPIIDEDSSLEDLIENRFYIENDQADLVYEDNTSVIVVPKTFEASKAYACTTEWCTQYPNNFNRYNEDGTLFIYLSQQHGFIQLFVDYQDDEETEVRDKDDDWLDNFEDKITIDHAKAIRNYLLGLSGVHATGEDRYPLRGYGAPTQDKDGDIVIGEKYNGKLIIKDIKSREVYLKVDDWEDLSYLLGNEYDSIGADILSGEHTYDFYNYDIDEIYWGFEFDNETINKIKETVKDHPNQELVSLVNDIEDENDFENFLKENKSSEDKDISDYVEIMERCIERAYSDAKGRADYDHAYNSITNHILEQLGADSNDISFSNSHMYIRLKWEDIPKEEETEETTVSILSEVFDPFYLRSDRDEEETEEFDKYFPPYYGHDGDIEDENLNLIFRDELVEEFY